MARAPAGDESAFADILRRHQAMVFSLALRIVGNRALAEELAQEVFLQLHRSLPALESGAHVAPGCGASSARRAIDLARQMARQRPQASLSDLPEFSAGVGLGPGQGAATDHRRGGSAAASLNLRAGAARTPAAAPAATAAGTAAIRGSVHHAPSPRPRREPARRAARRRHAPLSGRSGPLGNRGDAEYTAQHGEESPAAIARPAARTRASASRADEIMSLERELKRALRAQDPGGAFTARVLERLKQGAPAPDPRSSKARRPAMRAPGGSTARRSTVSRYRGVRTEACSPKAVCTARVPRRNARAAAGYRTVREVTVSSPSATGEMRARRRRRRGVRAWPGSPRWPRRSR